MMKRGSFDRVSVTIKDRLDRKFRFLGHAGQPLPEFLAQHRLPTSTIIAFQDGQPVSEWAVTLDPAHPIHLEMVRAYHLPDILDTSGTAPTDVSNPLYTKSVMMFTEDGGGIRNVSHFTGSDLTEYLHQVFLDSLTMPAPMFEENEHLVVGFSGGRDSLAMMLMFSRLKSQLPELRITAVTVNDCIAELDLSYTRNLCGSFGIEHRVVDPSEIRNGFRMSCTFQKALEALYDRYGRQRTLYALHHVMRRMVESVASELDVSKIALGLHLEDITASILRSMTTGYLVGYPWSRSFGPFTYVYPLWNITKKEITLYLLDSAQEYSQQGSAATFDRGTVDRDIYYAAADSIQDIWPGFSQHLYRGYQLLLDRMPIPTLFATCTNCASQYAVTTEAEPPSGTGENLCPVCTDFRDIGALWA